MESSSSIFSCHNFFSFPSFPSSIEISDEDYNLFHKIDRQLYTKLAHLLRRDAHESMRVVAFLIWLERVGYSHNAVKKVGDWPLNLLSELFSEIMVCLTGLETDKLTNKVYMTLSSMRKVCLSHVRHKDLYDNRVRVVNEVLTIVNEVCIRAFKDTSNDSIGTGVFTPRTGLETSTNGNVNSNGTGVFVPRVGLVGNADVDSHGTGVFAPRMGTGGNVNGYASGTGKSLQLELIMISVEKFSPIGVWVLIVGDKF